MENQVADVEGVADITGGWFGGAEKTKLEIRKSTILNAAFAMSWDKKRKKCKSSCWVCN